MPRPASYAYVHDVGRRLSFPAGPFFSYWIGGMIAFALGLMKLVDIVSPFKPKFDGLKG